MELGEIGSVSATFENIPLHPTLNRAFLAEFAKQETDPAEQKLDLLALEKMLDDGADINCSHEHGQTALHQVALIHSAKVAKFLLAKGADANGVDALGCTPLHVAATANSVEVLRVLVHSGASMEARTTGELQTPLHHAAKHGATAAVKAMELHGADVHARDRQGRTPLHIAVMHGHRETAQLLLDLGADSSAEDDLGQSCLSLILLKMPPVAYKALGRFYDCDPIRRHQSFNLTCLEPKPNAEHKETYRTPLKVIVSNQLFDVIKHPLVKKFIDLKWNSYGYAATWFHLVLELVYISLWTVLCLSLPLRSSHMAPKSRKDAWKWVLLMVCGVWLLYKVAREILDFFKSRAQLARWRCKYQRALEEDLSFCNPKWPQEVVYIRREMEELSNMKSYYLNDYWNIHDWLVNLLLLALLGVHAVHAIRPGDAVALLHVRVAAVALVPLWLSNLKHMRAFSFLGPFVVMLGKIVRYTFKFIFLSAQFFIPFFFSFWIIFGNNESIPWMQTVDTMLFTMFRMSVIDHYPYMEMCAVDTPMTYILVASFLLFTAILCNNIFIAMLNYAFATVYHDMEGNVYMQRASILLETEDEGALRGLREKARRRVHGEGAALVTPWDPTATAAEKGRGAAFGIKEELDDFLDSVRVRDDREPSQPDVKSIGRPQKRAVLRFRRELEILRREVTKQRRALDRHFHHAHLGLHSAVDALKPPHDATA
ncbi:transient receptor potential cation channel subfamily A member 1-like [Lethenteron reissneri]|uniref:transient receptor potential cation channel subfamily A member 1-like n=1 Tax=Lethenteron reissneri TaxID=7753 RepID=UPI002AB65E76|nr:transient receptor potential cation channel subfamily A member 1-like [Lethenteron reissneri]XP_061425517.1 transient receptor potential cation channel subfamily A member 1-like [Lethenteron reissneri]XP_061425518.1 transient receptor potential cation channel subfamily A member 1-like [Lethenteron reissneri]XP_061425519.1 transient receptor potential cation channel subfamily A member 1-like [Lethenteron reissneri]XP_061425520.1 transient receptor potential cation channel subfamily A member 1